MGPNNRGEVTPNLTGNVFAKTERTMKTNVIVRGVIKIIAGIFGLLGLAWMGMGVHFGVLGIRDRDMFQLAVMTPAFALMGGVVVAIGYQALWRFGPNAIRNVTALVCLALLGLVPTIEPTEKPADRMMRDLMDVAIHILPLILALLLYRLVSKKLIRLAGLEKTERSG